MHRAQTLDGHPYTQLRHQRIDYLKVLEAYHIYLLAFQPDHMNSILGNPDLFPSVIRDTEPANSINIYSYQLNGYYTCFPYFTSK